MNMCYGQINKINANTYNKQHYLRYCNSLDKSKMRFSEAMCRTDSRHMHGITPVLQHSESTPRRAFSTHIGRGAQKILRHFESSGKRKQANVCTSCCADICARNHAHACVRTLANTRIIMFAVFRFTLDPHLHFAGASALELPMRATPPQRLRLLRRSRWFAANG